MDEETTTTGASEDNPTGQAAGAGSSDDGASGGTQTDAGSLAAGERESYESRIRSFQSNYDRAQARVAELERQLTEGQGGSAGETGEFDPDTFASRMYDEFERRGELKFAAKEFRGEFKYADEGLFARATEFETVEALRAAVEASHNRVAGLVKAGVDEGVAALRAEMAERYGVHLDSPAGGEGKSPAGDPSIEEFARLSFAEQARLEEENPGITDRILRTAQS